MQTKMRLQKMQTPEILITKSAKAKKKKRSKSKR